MSLYHWLGVDGEVRNRAQRRGQWIGKTLAAASELSGIPMATLRRKTRTHDICHVRQAAMAAARWKGATYGEIGRFYAYDHSTVVHAVQAVERTPERFALAQAIEERVE